MSPNVSSSQLQGMMKLGFAIELFSGDSLGDLKMLPLVNFLLENRTLNSDIVGPLVKPKDPIPTLKSLQEVIPLLPHSDGRKDAIFFLVFYAFTVLAVGLRLYSVTVIKKKIRTEDWFSIFALFILGCNTAAFTAVNFNSMHIWETSLNDVKKWEKSLYVAEIVFCVAHWAVKIVFLIFYHALSTQRAYRIAIYVTAFFVTGLLFSATVVLAFQCQPINFWDHLLTSKCVNRLLAMQIFGAFIPIFDVVILILPITIVVKLSLKLKEKIILIVIFGVSGFICIASIMRLVVLKHFMESADFTWMIVPHGTWGTIEVDGLLVISCLPALKTIFFPRCDFSQSGVPRRPAMPSPNDSGSPSDSGSDAQKIRDEQLESKLRKRGLNIFGGVTRSFRLKSKLGTTVGDSVLRENVNVLGMGLSDGSRSESGEVINDDVDHCNFGAPKDGTQEYGGRIINITQLEEKGDVV